MNIVKNYAPITIHLGPDWPIKPLALNPHGNHDADYPNADHHNADHQPPVLPWIRFANLTPSPHRNHDANHDADHHDADHHDTDHREAYHQTPVLPALT